MSIIADIFKRAFGHNPPATPAPIEYWETVKEQECNWVDKKGNTIGGCVIFTQRCGYKHRVVGVGKDWKRHSYFAYAQLRAEEMEGKAKVEYYRILEALSVDERKLVERGLLDPFKIQLETT